MTASTSHIVTDVSERILRIGIDRPEKKNALTVAMYAELAAALDRAAGDPAVRVVLIHGHPQAFTSGNDLADFRSPPPTPAAEERPVLRFLRAISSAPKPIVAAVTGPAVGVGTTMLLHCDLVYAGEGARFQLPFVNLGLVPEAASSLLLPATLGYQRAAELLLLGEPFSASKARDHGIVTAVVADDQVLAAATAAAHKLAAQPPSAIRLTKKLMKQATAEAVAVRIGEESEHFGSRLVSPEAAEAFKAFAEKRPPDFSRFD
ncbi:MAG TPA: enoyl-CoA hydratase [Vicinamibacterales bacterium]|jgi:enoyl-CoA hydratase/carnithine racemase|nr:enoyl-CoA hydratase [Vicinamibacterales bacterium]